MERGDRKVAKAHFSSGIEAGRDDARRTGVAHEAMASLLYSRGSAHVEDGEFSVALEDFGTFSEVQRDTLERFLTKNVTP